MTTQRRRNVQRQKSTIALCARCAPMRLEYPQLLSKRSMCDFLHPRRSAVLAPGWKVKCVCFMYGLRASSRQLSLSLVRLDTHFIDLGSAIVCESERQRIIGPFESLVTFMIHLLHCAGPGHPSVAAIIVTVRMSLSPCRPPSDLKSACDCACMKL